VKGSDGILYGTTNGGGTYGLGTLFKFDPVTKAYAVLRHLQGADGGYCRGSLTFGNDGHLYGLGGQGGATGGGTIFRITTGGSFSVVRNVSGLDGTFPTGSLVKDANGNFYGMMSSGGAKSYGTIFRFNPATKAYTVLRSLDLTPDGGHPVAA
jgi:uncharacterized repeat protein (TIGR03803 family)